MKMMSWLKSLGILALVLGLAVGCASTPEPNGDDNERLAAEAIAAAQSAIEEAAALGAEWRDAQAVLDEAKAAYEAADYPTAIELANRAEAMARQAIADAQVPGTSSGSGSYQVVAGDNLWDIAGKGSVYGDPFRWPLIYKANKAKINDADLIYPGQVFDYDVSPSAGEVEAAVSHAKSRGAWSVGSVEASDEAYLAR
jgi:nucleoid-associated protein YgaU